MKRYEQILMLLEKGMCTLEEMEQELRVSERTIRGLLQELRKLSHRCGFRIITISNQGYQLQILDEIRFSNFRSSIENDMQYDSIDKTYRISIILYFLLQQKDFISLQRIAELLDVSRNTIIHDMEEVKLILNQHDMELISKKHYGVKITGDELSIRKLFSEYALLLKEYPDITQEYFSFCEHVKLETIKQHMILILNDHDIHMPDTIIDSILQHIQVLLFRIHQENYISDLHINEDMIDEPYEKAAHEIIEDLKLQFHMQIPDVEKAFLASQLIGKATADQVPEDEKQQLLIHIESALQELDKEFKTNLCEDDNLIQALLLHIYPLLKRISFGLVLCDSIIDLVSMQYANSFLIAIRFNELCDDLKDYCLSRDEIGYLALHFATHQEKRKQEKLKKITRIVLLSDRNRGTTSLLKVKATSIFPNAKIRVQQMHQLEETQGLDANLILTTGQLNKKITLPVIEINEYMDDNELLLMRDQLLAKDDDYGQLKKVTDLFSPKFFDIYESEADYLSVIERQCIRMVEEGYAAEDFPSLVLDREKKFTTIYKNGIAGPHGMKQSAMKDSIGISILRKPAIYEQKQVSCIFLINTMKGHLFVHQEISEYLLKIMNDTDLIQRIQKVSGYDELMRILGKLK